MDMPEGAELKCASPALDTMKVTVMSQQTANSERYKELFYTLENGEKKEFVFGVAGAMPWKVIGPIWRTDPICTTEMLQKCDLKYRKIIDAVEYDGDRSDVSRRFHLNFAVDTDTEYLGFEECFEPYDENAVKKYEESVFWQKQDRVTGRSCLQAPPVTVILRTSLTPLTQATLISSIWTNW